MFIAIVVCDADFLFIVDGSGSICQDRYVDTCRNWEILKQFIYDTVKHFNIAKDGSRVALVTFGNEAQVEFYLNE